MKIVLFGIAIMVILVAGLLPLVCLLAADPLPQKTQTLFTLAAISATFLAIYGFKG